MDLLEGHDEVRRRSMHVVASGFAVEDVLTSILENLLFGRIRSEIKYLRGILLESDSCSFAAKRKILRILQEDKNLVSGPEWNQLDKELAAIMRYRNAHAHGSIWKKKDGFFLGYFEGRPKKDFLDDEYWSKLEITFQNSFSKLLELQKWAIENCKNIQLENDSGGD